MIGLLLLLSCIASEAYTVLQPKTTPAYNALKRQTDKFSWQKQWYAVAVPEYLDESRPHKIQLLDENYVLWFDRAHKEWSALSDACPHRHAPLSEGIVQPEGTLLCAYHAWRFNKSGQCVDIPQSLKFDKTSHCSSTRACAKSFPV
jgi:phenylpropionate dioxygenase-like ring-hydroxylating dioxygenase large terminal subunit